MSAELFAIVIQLVFEAITINCDIDLINVFNDIKNRKDALIKDIIGQTDRILEEDCLFPLSRENTIDSKDYKIYFKSLDDIKSPFDSQLTNNF